MDTGYLTTQVTTIIGQLHAIFDEIGVPQNERDARETELFAALAETLHNHLRRVNAEKNEMTEEAQKIIKAIKQMEASLDDEEQSGGYELASTALRVTYPLNKCLGDLKEKHKVITRLHKERFEQVKKLVQALQSYSSHLESSFVKIKLPPTSSNSCSPNFDLSPSYVASLDEEFSRVYDEYNKRVSTVQAIAEEIIRLWSELGTPQAQTDTAIVKSYRDAPEQLGLHRGDIDRIRSRRDKLLEEKKGREKRLAEVKTTIEGLWNRLGVADSDRKAFLAANRGCGLRTINEYEEELARLNELKRQNLHLFVEDARVRLQELWDGLYFSEEEMLEFTPAFSDVYSDALLSAHEAEIDRLQTLKEQRAPVLEVIDKHRSLINDRQTLAASANDATRLTARGAKGEKRDPTRLLREEKMRKRIAKELPKVTAELTKTLEQYEEEYGRPFLVHGERYLDEIAAAEAKAPPPRSKTPSGLPPRSRTPNALPPRSKTPSAVPTAKPPPAGHGRANSVVNVRGGLPPATAQTPNVNGGTLRRNPLASSTSTAPASGIRSPSKIPSRVPLASLQNGNNSPERRPNPPPHHVSHDYAHEADTTRKMGPPRAPPPKMRDLYTRPQEQSAAMSYSSAPTPGTVSEVSSTDSHDSSRYVRPISPEDVYDDRERMSYMSTSLLDRDRAYHQHHQDHDYQSSIQRHYPPSAPSISSSRQEASRQTSNTSSNMTTGTTASGSENWETYSDASDVEPERDARETYYAKVRAATTTTGKRPMIVGGGYGQMAPPSKIRAQKRVGGLGDDGSALREKGLVGMRVEGSDAAWTTDAEETY